MNLGHDYKAEAWSIYENNVQSYRGLAVSAQSIYLAIGAILVTVDSLIPLTIVFVAAMITTWYIFFPAIFSRCAIVDYHKFRLPDTFTKDGEWRSEKSGDDRLDEKDYARTTNFSLRQRVYKNLSRDSYRFRTLRTTRLKLDVLLPAVFSATWLVFVVFRALE